MPIEAVPEHRGEGLVGFTVAGAAGRQVLDMGNLVFIADLGPEMIEESLDFHR